MISGNVPNHLVVGARTGFLNALKTTPMPWQRVAGEINATAKATDLVDIGAAPMPTEGTPVTQETWVEKYLQIKPRDWSIVVRISYNAIQDDQTNSLNAKVRSAGANFQKAINNLVFKALNAGDATTYGLCYDGNEFFDASHVDKGAAYTTAQSNLGVLPLSLPNFETAMVAASAFLNDQGEYTEYNYDLLVVNQAQRNIASQIAENADDYTTGRRAQNPYAGSIQYVVSPQITSGSWSLLASSEAAKPLYVIMREQPSLQDYGFDAMGSDGGQYWFKFYARYNVGYGDWRLAYMGAT